MAWGSREPDRIIVKRGPWDIIGWIILIILVIAIIFGCLIIGVLGSVCSSVGIIAAICLLATVIHK